MCVANTKYTESYQILSFDFLLPEHGANLGNLGLIHPPYVVAVKQNGQVILNIPTQHKVPHHEVGRVEQLQNVLVVLQVAGDDSLKNYFHILYDHFHRIISNVTFV